MAATVLIKRWTGASGSITKTDVTGINSVLASNDTHQATAAGSNDPIRIPSSGTNYSYWATFGFNCSVAPSGTINALKFYSDGANNLGTGVTLVAREANVGADSGYRQATGTQGTTGAQLTQAAHGGLVGTTEPSNVFALTSGSPMSLTGSTTGTGDFGDLVVMQMEVASTASPGVTGTETMSYQYDET